MTTCDRISASSAFIRAAIEATASEHSSWKEFNQTQTSLNQPSLSKASRPSFAFSFLTRETGRGWLPGCSSRRTSPPDQLCSHSDRENIRSNTILNSSCLPFIHRSSMFHIFSTAAWVTNQRQARPPCWCWRWCGRLPAGQLQPPRPPPQRELPEPDQVYILVKVCSSMGNVSTKHWNIQHTTQCGISLTIFSSHFISNGLSGAPHQQPIFPAEIFSLQFPNKQLFFHLNPR